MDSHPYQLRRIQLQEFKSVHEATIDLSPLTVVVGANSSGKSTLLQSILAVTQAVRAGGGTSEFPLNGEFVRLGTFDETRHFLAADEDAPIRISFEIVEQGQGFWRALPREADDSKPVPTRMMWNAYISSGHSDDPKDGSPGFARLSSIQMEIDSIPSEGEPVRLLSCDISEFGAALEGVNRTHFLGRSRFGMSGQAISASGRIQDWQTGTSGKIDALVMDGGVPQLLLRRRTRFEQVAEAWWNVASELLVDELEANKRDEAVAEGPRKLDLAAVKQARKDIEALNAEAGDTDLLSTAATGRIGTWSDALTSKWYKLLAQLNDKEKDKVAGSMLQLGEAEFRKRLKNQLRGDQTLKDQIVVRHSGPAGEALWRWGLVAQSFFRSSVRYLGPLREAPHVLYDPGPSKLDLGNEGKYAAAVLHAQSRRKVLMPTPAGAGETRMLGYALDYWLNEFGLADEARSEDRGRIGIGLSVKPKGIDRKVDLTSVGVGVSQVLPVMLLCLLAEPGTLVVLEQPELHLHPKLQLDLADFLLACARSGRQLVVETHSEHLVNRLRYQIAQDETESTHQLISLVFAENHNGITTYRAPEINQFGGLGDDWPAGFLDVTAKQSKELIKESLAKRRREANPAES
jgi:predicted ATPase